MSMKKTQNKKCPCHDEKQCGLHHYLLADEGCECTCPKPDPFGDTPVVCMGCGAIFVAESVLWDKESEAEFKKACEAGGTFTGKSCHVCVPEDGIIGCRQTRIPGRWRLLRGPLRVPRKDGKPAGS